MKLLRFKHIGLALAVSALGGCAACNGPSRKFDSRNLQVQSVAKFIAPDKMRIGASIINPTDSIWFVERPFSMRVTVDVYDQVGRRIGFGSDSIEIPLPAREYIRLDSVSESGDCDGAEQFLVLNVPMPSDGASKYAILVNVAISCNAYTLHSSDPIRIHIDKIVHEFDGKAIRIGATSIRTEGGSGADKGSGVELPENGDDPGPVNL